MKRFRFPLEQVRAWRRLEMESEQARLDQCLTRLHEAEHSEARVERERLETDQAQRDMRSANAVLSPCELAAIASYHESARRTAAVLAGKREDASAEAERQRKALLEARRRFEVLDRARANALRLWTGELDRWMEAAAAEIYLAAWGRRAKKPKADLDRAAGEGQVPPRRGL